MTSSLLFKFDKKSPNSDSWFLFTSIIVGARVIPCLGDKAVGEFDLRSVIDCPPFIAEILLDDAVLLVDDLGEIND